MLNAALFLHADSLHLSALRVAKIYNKTMQPRPQLQGLAMMY